LVSEIIASILSSTSLATLEGWPSQVGVARMRMSLGHELAVEPRPLVTLAEVRLHTRGDVSVDDADDGDLHGLLAESADHDVRQRLGVRGGW
jgi:hypothetical protein